MLHDYYCKYNIAQSVHEKLIAMCTITYGQHEGRVDLQKALLILAGIMSECLMDYDDPFRELAVLQKDNGHDGVGVRLQDNLKTPEISIVDLDEYLEIGRSLARLYMDDELENARTLYEAILGIVTDGIALNGGDKQIRAQQRAFFIKALHYSLSFEIIAHLFCDRVIDLKIAQDEWSVSDCIMAMSGLSGRYFAFASLQEDDSSENLTFAQRYSHLGCSKDAREHDENRQVFSEHNVLELITSEAFRMGVPTGAGVLHGVAANDEQYRAYPHLIYSLEPAFAILAERYGIESYALKTVAVAKATGRMMAVACCGVDPEVEHVIAKPLALSSFIGSARHFGRA